MPTSTTTTTSDAPLDAVLDRVREAVKEAVLPIVVLDLDSTIIDTGSRHLAIVRDYAADRDSALLKDLVATLGAHDFGYLVEAPLRARGWGDDADYDDLRAYWWDRFFDDAYCRHDQARPGAVAFAQRVVDAGGMAYYLTARPAGMREGTVHVLSRHGFPLLRGRAVLHMKPHANLDDHRFKRGALAEIRSLQGRVCATFENEPAHAHALLEAFPDALHYLVGDIRSPRAPEPHESLILLPSFEL